MKKGRMSIGLLMLVAAGLLAGCVGDGAAVQATDVPVVAQGAADKVVAEAVIEPARSATLTFDVPGDVAEVLVREGDPVRAGDALVRLETDALDRALRRADLALRQAQLRLARLQEPPDERDVQIAQAAVNDAAAAYQEAKKALTITEHSVSVGDDVRAARYARDETYRIYQDLQAKYDRREAGVTEQRLAAAHDAYLNALGAYNRAVENADLQLLAARNAVTRAYHALEQAQNNLDELLAGADKADIQAARLDVEAAQLGLEEAQSALEEATLVAPFDGVVTTLNVNPGDALGVGQPVLVLATLDRLQARTVDLTELDVVRIAVGQPAVVSVDALPGQTFAGVVREIALQPGDYRGDVVYAVTVELTDAADSPLRWGMTALVEIEAR